MQHLAIILHVSDNAVNDDQRLCISLQTGKSTHEHGATHCQLSATCYRMDVSSQLLGHQRVDALTSRIVEIQSCTGNGRSGGSLVDRTESIGIELSIGLLRLLADRFL